MVTREYLEEQLAHLTKQAEQALVTLHNANGAISCIRHLLEVFDAGQHGDGVEVEPQQSEAQS